ncbi:flagellar biosynthesis protein [Desulfuromusa kysingii]|uniref:Flagellar biosynthesis protein n=1 Tax=Desulfuromusa kysingii TaxID=37625 RepID=A0A1H3VN22_9BACT|nr:EscU/YscU/HrcU family type III secretion system export apparatus switch protein [Desulfuromusa kysingii]SDZ76186.1 flagellar biosynthesis protein [Desulfuromusa kysingii]
MIDRDQNKLQAVALRYDRRPTSTPEIVASGSGDLAQQIIAAAKEAGVDIVQDPDLLEVLGRIPVGEEVPAELFQAVAEILAFIYRINGRYATEQS